MYLRPVIRTDCFVYIISSLCLKKENHFVSRCKQSRSLQRLRSNYRRAMQVQLHTKQKTHLISVLSQISSFGIVIFFHTLLELRYNVPRLILSVSYTEAGRQLSVNEMKFNSAGDDAHFNHSLSANKRLMGSRQEGTAN